MKKIVEILIVIIGIIGIILIGFGLYYGLIKNNKDTNNTNSKDKYLEVLKGNIDFYDINEQFIEKKATIFDKLGTKKIDVKYALADIDNTKSKDNELIVLAKNKTLIIKEINNNMYGYTFDPIDLTLFKKDGTMYCKQVNQICRLSFKTDEYSYESIINHQIKALSTEEVDKILEEFNNKEELTFKQFKN